jgi:hypothetical protein
MSAPVWINGPEMTEAAPPVDFAAPSPTCFAGFLTACAS